MGYGAKARNVLEEIVRRAMALGRLTYDALFGTQRKFAESKDRLIVACCSRRAGKSYAVAYKLVEAALKHPGSMPLYLTMTRETARGIIWDPISELVKVAGASVRFNKANGDITFANGSIIKLRGVRDRRDADKLRGPKYPIVVIDEAQGMPSYLREVIFDVIEPATIDYPGSQIIMTGTPNASCSGPFRDAFHNEGEMKGWKAFHWTIHENRHFINNNIDVKAFLDELRERRQITEKDSGYQREWHGAWVRDDEAGVYRYDAARNNIGSREWAELMSSADDWEYGLGLDLGWNDPTAFSLCAWSQSAGRFVVVETYERTEMSTDAIAKMIAEYRSEYGWMTVVADTGGYGRDICDELERIHGITVEPAKKTAKAAYIKAMNSDFGSASIRIVVPNNSDLCEQLELLQWMEGSIDLGRPKEDRSTPNHMADATLYCWRNSYHSWGLHTTAGPVIGSDEWHRQQEDKMEREAERRILEKDNHVGY